MVEQLPTLPPIARLSPLVIRILGDNPSKFTLQGTNTYLVGSGRRRILIDTGEGRAEWKARVQKVLEDENAEIESVLLTHWHGDHVGGIEDVKEIIAQTKRRPNSSGSGGEEDVKFYKNRPESGQTEIKDGQSFTTEGATLKSFFCPGHTNDHMAFVIEQEDAMFTGDNVLGHGTAVFEDLAAYMRSLETMQHQFSGRAYPGHGMEIEDGKGKIKEYIAHRREREEQALEVLKGERPEGQEGGGEGWRSMSMVKVIYSQYPEHLHGPAEGGLVQVLAKLEKDGKVVKCKDGTWKLADKASL